MKHTHYPIWTLLLVTSSVPVLAQKSASHSRSGSTNKQKVAYVVEEEGHQAIYLMDLDGKNRKRLVGGPMDSYDPVWSPDATRIAFTRRKNEKDTTASLYVIRADGTGLKRLTHSRYYDGDPKWLPDGHRIVFRRQERPSHSYVISAEGTGERRCPASWAGEWSPDGKTVLFDRPTTTEEDEHRGDLYVQKIGHRAKRLTFFRSPEIAYAWSPDGKRIAFWSYTRKGRTGQSLFVVNANGSGMRRLPTRNLEYTDSLKWSPTGKQIGFAARIRPKGMNYTSILERDQLYIIGVNGQGLRRLTSEPYGSRRFHWLEDGKKVLLESEEDYPPKKVIRIVDVKSKKMTRLNWAASDIVLSPLR